jgi:16S rRNA processing protein RimM
MTKSPDEWTVLAHLLRPQGRKGELLAELFTDFPERFEDKKQVFLSPPEYAGDEAGLRTAEVSSFWLPLGKNEGRIVLHFAGVDSISDAETLAGLDVVIAREDRLPLDDESVYISELTGCTLYDGATPVGMISDVQFPMTPDGARRMDEAAPLLVVTDGDGEEILIPFAKAFLTGVDTKARRVDMVLPEGLVEVNRPSVAPPAQKR